MKIITKFSASILVALGLGVGGSAQAKGGHGGGHSGGGHSRGGHHSGGHHSGGHHSGGHHSGGGGSGHSIHRGAHGISHYGYIGSGFYSYPRYGSYYGGRSYYGYRSTPYYRSQVAAYQTDYSLAAEVQMALARRGYYRGAIDGIIGNGTRRALHSFQIAKRLPVTNRIDRATLQALNLG